MRIVEDVKKIKKNKGMIKNDKSENNVKGKRIIKRSKDRYGLTIFYE